MGNPWAYDFSAIGRRAAPLMVIIGSDSDPRSQRGGYGMSGNSDVHQLIPGTLQFDQLNLSRQFYNPKSRQDLAPYDCVLNLVTDPDQHPKTLELLRKLLRGYRGRVINRPEAVVRSSRDLVARRLSGIEGLRVPKVVRLRNPKPGAAPAAMERAGLGFPVIVRLAGTHTGQIVGRVNSAEELDEACRGSGDYVLTEFIDFASADGLYRKYRLWSFGQRTVFKHVIISNAWNIHNKDRSRIMPGRPDLIEEERRLFSRPEGTLPDHVHAIFDIVRARLGLDFFGMDFGIDRHGQTVLFEANATMSYAMTFEPPFKYLELAGPPARDAFKQMLFPSK
jgi:hypothetical protein